MLLMLFCLHESVYSQSQKTRIVLNAKIVENNSEKNNLKFKITIKNVGHDTILVNKEILVLSNKLQEADIGFEIYKVQNGKELDWQNNCHDMDVGRLKPLTKNKYDTLYNNTSKLVIANVFRDCEWERGNYKIRFIFYLDDIKSKKIRVYKFCSKWVSFKFS